MIRLVMNKKIYTYERVIFPDGIVESNCDIVRYMRFYNKPESLANCVFDIYRTPVTNLLQSYEEIRAQYGKNCRYKIHRAERENIKFIVFDKISLDNDADLIEDVINKYYVFCDQISMQNLKNNLNPPEFRKMIANHNIVISKAEYENGWTYHVYQTDGKNALLWFTFSDYRKENANKSMAGWANRGLHDYDICFFKNAGYEKYDWGNIASETEPNEIDNFKMSFGGELKDAYCCFVGKTLKGKLLIWLRGLKQRG